MHRPTLASLYTLTNAATIKNLSEPKYYFGAENALPPLLTGDVNLKWERLSWYVRTDRPGDKHFHTPLQIIFALGWHYRKVISHMGCDDMSVL